MCIRDSYQVIRRMMDICEKYNLDYEVEEIFAAQNRNKTQPGVSILPQVEQTHGEKAVEAHIPVSYTHLNIDSKRIVARAQMA